jgi:hypothetical protein
MKKKSKKLLLLAIAIVLVLCLLWPAFQVATPDYYRRVVCVGLVKQYLEQHEKPLRKLTEIDYLKEMIEISESEVLPTPTKRRNVLVFNKEYLKSESPDWILIVLGKDSDSWIRGDWVITKSIESKRVRNATKLINSPDNLDYYYLYLTDSRLYEEEQ